MSKRKRLCSPERRDVLSKIDTDLCVELLMDSSSLELRNWTSDEYHQASKSETINWLQGNPTAYSTKHPSEIMTHCLCYFHSDAYDVKFKNMNFEPILHRLMAHGYDINEGQDPPLTAGIDIDCIALALLKQKELDVNITVDIMGSSLLCVAMENGSLTVFRNVLQKFNASNLNSVNYYGHPEEPHVKSWIGITLFDFATLRPNVSIEHVAEILKLADSDGTGVIPKHSEAFSTFLLFGNLPTLKKQTGGVPIKRRDTVTTMMREAQHRIQAYQCSITETLIMALPEFFVRELVFLIRDILILPYYIESTHL